MQVLRSALALLLFLLASLLTYSQTRIIAHRGGPGATFPENSVSAIEASLKKGVDALEIDVHQTKDSVLVVIHDKTANRTTSGSGYIKDLEWNEIKKFDLDANEAVPLLEDVMKKVNGNSFLIIEIKEGDNYYPGIEKRIAGMIKKYDAYNWCAVHSFKDEVLEKMNGIDTNITLHKLLIAKPFCLPLFIDMKLRVISFKKYDYIDEFSVNHHFAGRLLIRKVHGMGKKINAWNVNDEKKKNKMIKKGIDGIITDFP